MVHFIMGRAGTGKSTQVRARIAKAAQEGKRVYLFVPEQFTFETERSYYDALGAKIFRQVQVLSFTRLAHNLFKEFGGVSGDYADDCVKLILMDLALHEVKDKLQVYGRAMKHTPFAQNMVDLIGELKNADCTTLDFERRIGDLPDGRLKQKSQDISLIYDTYEALLSERYKDALDDLSKAAEWIRQKQYFAGTVVFIDEFKGFTEKEYALIRLMMKQAQDTTITLCTDHVGGENSLFYCVNQTYADLTQLARKEQVRIAAPEVLRDNHRFRTPALAHLEQNVFESVILPFEGTNDSVTAVLAANEYDEVDYVLAAIRGLAESGQYRYRDMVVITRDLASYRSCLETAFEKYEVPFYLDTRKSAAQNPLMRMVEWALSCAVQGVSTDAVLSLLKCGLTPFSVTEISRLENYAYLWDLKPEDWKRPFTFSIFGVNPPRGEEQQCEQEETLAALNRIRQTVVDALERFAGRMQGSDVRTMSRALLAFLQELGVREAVNQKLAGLNEAISADLVLADEYRRVWEMIGQIAQVLTSAIGDHAMSAKRYAELFSLVVSKLDLGTIPQTLDSVTVGSAERIRTDCPKVVFILGVNDKVFPYIPDNTGIYTDTERRELIEVLGLGLSKPLKERIKEEKFIAYKALTTPSERLYLSARKADIKGTSMAPSYLYAQLKRMFGSESITDTDDLDRLFFCKTKQSAFSVLAYQFRQDDVLTASLKECFSTDPAYAPRMAGIARQLNRGAFRLHNRETARELFGQRVTMSPTRVEAYYKCKFRYFCEHGLGLKKREKIELSAVSRGTIVHDILYHVCTQITDFHQFDEKQIRTLIKQAVDEYAKRMGGYEHQSKRFRYLYERLQKSVFVLIQRLFEELQNSAFQPTDFECQIGGSGEVKPYTFTSADGITIRIQGIIDRVDSYQNEQGETFIRIIDYKTGTKEFKLADIINGMNLQMFLYLLCLEKNGVGRYQQVRGAGALYMPASDLNEKLHRHANDRDREQAVTAHYRMKGVVLDNEQVVKAMEPDLQGVYTPVSVKKAAFDKEQNLKDGVFVEHRANEEFFSAASMEVLLTEEQIGKLFASVEHSIAQMVDELYSGNIEAKPLVGRSVNGCDFCPFQHSCGFEPNDPVREYLDLKKKDLFAYLDKQQANK